MDNYMKGNLKAAKYFFGAMIFIMALSFGRNLPAPAATVPLDQPVEQVKDSSDSELPKIPEAKKMGYSEKKHKNTIMERLNLANAATAVSSMLTEEEKKKAAKYNNLSFVLGPAQQQKYKVSDKIVAYKKAKCLAYIDKYKEWAIQEMELYGIPASITLAQGLVESNAGDSRLSRNENNHFGIKCKKKCLGCRCANYADDDKYDMFRIFSTPWYSFREHSKLLNGQRYKHLLKLKTTDYKNWCHGLQAAGYATNKRYAVTLIAVIEKLELNKFDKNK